MYDLNNKKIDIRYYLDFLYTNTIDFVGNKEAIISNPNPYLSIVKIFNISYNKETLISLDVKEYILNYYSNDRDNFIKNLKGEYLRHYNCDIPEELEFYISDFLSKNKILVKK